MEPFYILNIILFLINAIFFHFHKKSIFKKIIIYDYPKKGIKLHKKPTLLISGIIILNFLIFNIIHLNVYENLNYKTSLIFIILSTIFFLIGFVDDYKKLTPIKKSVLIIFSLIIFLPLDNIFIVRSLTFFNDKLIIDLNDGAIFFTILCIYLLFNFYNFIDGTNGVAISVAIYWLLFNYIYGNYLNTLILSICICLLFILVLNLLGKLFLGNAGTNILSIFIGIIFIANYNLSNIEIDQIILVMLLPFIDSLRITISRLIQNKSPFIGDLNHYHHLLGLVISKKYVFLIYLLISIFPFLISNYLNSFVSFLLFLSFYFSSIYVFKKFRRNIKV